MIFAHIRSSFADAFFPRLAEWVAAGVLFALGWMLMVNDGLMTPGSGRGYHLLLEVASQPVWSVVRLLISAES